jgi:dipeptidyl aminopeptidase/acylaminoacyl peptidase
MRLRKILIFTVVIFGLIAGAAYLAAGVSIYDRLSQTQAHCSGRFEGNTPAAFTHQQVDTTPYLMPTYEEVTFSSRDDAITIAGWYIPAQTANPADAPAVIMVHGFRSCKSNPEVLFPAGILNRVGYNVLLIDLREHGESQVIDGRIAAGVDEYRDVLGAWDWLIAEKGIPAERIGLFGTSLGAAAVMIAAGQELRVAAVWEDSSFADINVAIEAELARNGYPIWLAPAAPLVGRLVNGIDLTALSPLDGAAAMEGRPVFITHGEADVRMSAQYANDLAEAVRADGGEVEPLILTGSGHVMGMFDHPDEYEQALIAFFDAALRGSAGEE